MTSLTFWSILNARIFVLAGWSVYFFTLLAPSGLAAADQRPVVGPGASKEAVLDAYGWPSGQTQAGAKEILTYPQGRVILDKGRVEVVEFSMKVPWPAPKPRPGAVGTPTPGDSWFTSWSEALREAQRRQVRILTVFTGSDWSPPSKQFLTEVSEAPDFLTAFLGSFVLLRLDFPTRAMQSKELRAQNADLRERFEVTTYPSILLVESDGVLAARVDLHSSTAGDPYLNQVVAAIKAARNSLRPSLGATNVPAGSKASGKPVNILTADRLSVPAAPGSAAVGSATSASLSSAGLALTWGLGGGAVLVVALLWLFLRRRPTVSGEVSTAAERVADAASGVPSLVELAEWPHARVRGVVGALAGTDGYEVSLRAGGGEGDLSLVRSGEDRTSVIVMCSAATVGPVSAKRLRELFGTITLEEVGTGWFVGMGGFSAEARDYAREHGLVLIGKEGLREQMRALTERDLAHVLARGK